MKYLILSLLFLVGCAKNDPSLPNEPNQITYKEYLLSIDPSLSSVQSLRHFVFIHVKFGSNFPPNNILDPIKNLEGLLPQIYSYRCWGISATYRYTLGAFGFKSRYVGLYAQDHESHASTEVFENGKWHVSDATYDVDYLGTWPETAPTFLGVSAADRPPLEPKYMWHIEVGSYDYLNQYIDDYKY